MAQVVIVDDLIPHESYYDGWDQDELFNTEFNNGVEHRWHSERGKHDRVTIHEYWICAETNETGDCIWMMMSICERRTIEWVVRGFCILWNKGMTAKILYCPGA